MGRWGAYLVALAATVIAVSGGQSWVLFTVDDPVLGPGARTASGYAVSSALSAAAVLGVVAILTALLTRQRLRMVALLVLTADGVWATWLAVQVILDPTSAAGQGTSAELRATTTGAAVVVDASVSAWVWVWVAGSVVLALGALLLTYAVWAQTRSRTPLVHRANAAHRDRDRDTTLPSTERERRDNTAAWNDLSRGEDPTDDS